MSEKHLSSKSSDWFDAAIVVDKTSRLSGVIFFALCAVAIFAVLMFGAVDVWALGLLTLFVGIIAILWLCDAWQTKSFSFSTNLLQIPLAGLILIGLIQLLPLRGSNVSSDLLPTQASNTLSIAPYLTRFAVVQLIIYFVFFAAAFTFINNQKRLRKAVLTVIIFGATIGFFAILQKLSNLEGIYGARQSADAFSFGTYINQHHFAALMEMTLALSLGLLFGKGMGRDKKIFLLTAVVIMGITILFTGSRGGLLSLLGIVGFIVAINLFRKSRKSGETDNLDEEESTNLFRRNLFLIGGGLAILLGLFGSVLLLGGDQSLLRGVGVWTNPTQDLSNGRSHFWQVALKIISDFPILGTGFDTFGIAFTRYDTWNGSLRVEQTHNDYLQILSDGGVLGLICVLAFIALLFKQSLQIIAKSSDNFRRNAAAGALAGCFGIMIHSFFDFPLRTPANGYFFLLLAVLATATINYPKLYRRKKQSINNQ